MRMGNWRGPGRARNSLSRAHTHTCATTSLLDARRARPNAQPRALTLLRHRPRARFADFKFIPFNLYFTSRCEHKTQACQLLATVRARARATSGAPAACCWLLGSSQSGEPAPTTRHNPSVRAPTDLRRHRIVCGADASLMCSSSCLELNYSSSQLVS